MPTFSYDARDLSGNAVSGIIEADAPGGAAASLREQGLFPTRIEILRGAPAAAAVVTPPRLPEIGINGPVAPTSPMPPPMMTPTGPAAATPPPFVDRQPGLSLFPWLTGVPLPELAMLYRQFAALLDAGVPIAQSLGTLADQARSGKLRHILRECQTAVASGYPLSAVLKNYPTVFTPLQYEMIRAGEMSGGMDLMCRRMADYLEREIDLRRRLKRETLPQKFTLGVAALVILVLAFVFGGMGMLLFALGLEAFLVGGAFAVWCLGRFLYQIPDIAAFWDGFKLYLPGIGDVGRRYATARFARSLGTLFSGGVLLANAVEISARACGNGAIAKRLLANVSALTYGGGLSEMLARSGLLSPLAVQMARTGEQTGSLDTMMDKVADYLESEADVKSHQLSVGLGVALTIVSGIITFVILLEGYGGYLHQAVNIGNQ